jgi:flagellar hook-length control protein FliK
VATDFMLLVQQLLGQTQAPPVGSMPVASETLQQAVASEDELEEGKVNECAGLAALLALLPQASAGAPVAKTPAEASAALGSAIDSVMQRAPTRSPLLTDVSGEGAAERLLGELTPSEPMPETVDSEIASFAPATPEASSTAHRAAHAETALSRVVQAPVGSNAWSDEIATRLTLMAEQGKQAASLRLSPEHLGPLEVRITVSDDQASVWFGAAHADTRAAIEQALPRLRELFEAQGMSLADAGVFREPPRDQPHSQASSPTLADDAAAAEESVTIARARLGLIDAYA